MDPQQMDSGSAARQLSDQASRASQQSPDATALAAAARTKEAPPPAEAGKPVAEALPDATALAAAARAKEAPAPAEAGRPDARSGWGLKPGDEFASPLGAEAAVRGESEETQTAPFETLYTLAGSGAFLLASQPGRLLVGTVPVDLPALEGAAEGFFARLEGLAGGGEDTAITHGLPPWLLAATVSATAVFEFARRRAAAPAKDAGTSDSGTAGRETSPELALLPPGGQP
jgi:hypothetical protein